MKAKKFPFNRDELIGLIDYNPLTGAFKSKCPRGNLKIGDTVGYKNVDGYIRLKIGNELFSAQRVAWFIYHGYDPYGYQIDHINHNRSDNRIENLRLVTHQDNHRNVSRNKLNKTGKTGVRFRKQSAKIKEGYYAEIKVDNKKIYIGRYDTFEEAKLAREKAEKEFGFHINHGR